MLGSPSLRPLLPPFSADHGSARERTTRPNCSSLESGAPGVLPTDRRGGGGRMRWARWQPARIQSNERAPGCRGDEGRRRICAHAEIETSALARTHTWRGHRLTDTIPKIFSETSTGFSHALANAGTHLESHNLDNYFFSMRRLT